MIPIVLLVTLGAASVLAGDPTAEPAAPSVVRTYDLGSLTTRAIRSTMLNLAPSMDPEPVEGTELDAAVGLPSEAVLELMSSAFPDQFEYADRGLWMRSDEELVVRAPQELQDRVAALIAGLEGAVNEHAVLRVDVITLPTARLGGRDWRGVVSSQAAEELRALAGSDASRRTHRLSIHAGRPALVDLRREQQILLDYDVEIAQGAAIHDPVVVTLALGTRLVVSAAPRADGLALAYVLDHSDPLGEPERHTMRQRLLVTGEAYAETVASSQALQSMQAVTRSVAGSAALASGSALVLRSDLDLAGVKNSEFVVIEQVDGGLSTAHTLSGAGIVLVNTGAVEPPRCGFAGGWPGSGGWPRGTESLGWDQRETWVGAGLGHGDAYVALEMIASVSTGLSLSYWDPWLVGVPDPDAVRELRDAGTEVSDIADVLAAFAPSAEMLDLHVTARRGGRDGGRVASCVLPVQVGRECVAALGREELVASDADVEVAQNAAASDPVVLVDFEGLILRARPHRGAGGALVLDLAGEARVQIDRERFDLESPMLDSLDLSAFDRLLFDERLVLTPGTAPVVLTESSGEGGGAALTLEVAVR